LDIRGPLMVVCSLAEVRFLWGAPHGLGWRLRSAGTSYAESGRDHVKAVARRMKTTPCSEAEEWDVVKEFAACVKIVLSMKRRQAALDTKPALKGE